MAATGHSAGSVGIASGFTGNPLLNLHIDNGSAIAYLMKGSQSIIQHNEVTDTAVVNFQITYPVA
jgi:hypothetical protein